MKTNRRAIQEQEAVSASGSGIKIREATFEDCIDLYRPDSNWLRTAEDDSFDYESLIQSHDGLVLVAENGGLKGFVAARRGRSTFLSVATICALGVEGESEKEKNVTEDRLLCELLERLRGVDSIYIELSSKSAVKCYLERGFLVIKRFLRASAPTRQQVTRMVLRLRQQKDPAAEAENQEAGLS